LTLRSPGEDNVLMATRRGVMDDVRPHAVLALSAPSIDSALPFSEVCPAG